MGTKKSKSKMGRPPKPKSEKMAIRVMVNMTPGEWKRIKAEVDRTGESPSEVLLRPWRKQKRD